ncbi:hypothetical protein [Pedobacter ureilyticus]|uniref:Uncharacterized protein n=1 Tax=Pedobacter ureilyticus TaxID=1393051 RepID=A0ABW9J952_9SPHI|nr:hypothetical protein [Pedobacter helvus]
MSLISYLKEINIGWKLSLFLVVFCIWPVSAYLIFNFQNQLFIALDLWKLTLLSSAIATPFLVINSGISFLLASPRDKRLMWEQTQDQHLSSTVLIGVTITLFILSAGAASALVDCTIKTVKLIMAIAELTFLIAVIWSKKIEDRNFLLNSNNEVDAPQ